MAAAFLAGLAIVTAGIILSIGRSTSAASVTVQLGGVVVTGAGAIVVLVRGATIGADFGNGLGPSFGLDGLSAFFVVVVCGSAAPAFLVAQDALGSSASARALIALTGGFVLALVGVLTARDAVTFLGFWELMTLIPATAILVARRDAAVRHAVFVYLAITHLGGVGVWVALLTLAQEGAIGGTMPATGLQAMVVIAALIGFGTKAGLVPLHAWLPRAHPVAPAHISALMSAVMIKVALYGLIRVLFEWIGPLPLWVGLTVLGLGALSALGGVLYALVQRELKRLLAFSSIENIGIVALGLGASLVLTDTHEPLWASVAFAAALLHVANHAAIKTLLFLGAGVFTSAVGALQLDQLGGLLRRMPWTGWSFLIGCAAIAGVPVLNGFASEWLTLQSLLQVAFDGGVGVSVAGALAAAALAVSAALAVYCFVKVAGLVLLGAPRTPEAARAQDPPMRSRIAMVLLAASCVLLGLVPGLLVPTLAALGPRPAAVGRGLQIDLPGTGGFAPVGLFVVLALVVAGVLRASAGGARRAQPTPPWACGQRVGRELSWTSAGFTKPLRLVLEVVYRPRREFDVRTQGGIVREVSYQAEVPHLFDTWLYRPAYRVALRAATFVRRLQSGSLRLYLCYLIALVIVALVVLRLGGVS